MQKSALYSNPSPTFGYDPFEMNVPIPESSFIVQISQITGNFLCRSLGQ
jgi:hypothetical protein